MKSYSILKSQEPLGQVFVHKSNYWTNVIWSDEGLQTKSQTITIPAHPVVTECLYCTTFYGNPSNSCWQTDTVIYRTTLLAWLKNKCQTQQTEKQISFALSPMWSLHSLWIWMFIPHINLIIKFSLTVSVSAAPSNTLNVKSFSIK